MSLAFGPVKQEFDELRTLTIRLGRDMFERRRRCGSREEGGREKQLLQISRGSRDADVDLVSFEFSLDVL